MRRVFLVSLSLSLQSCQHGTPAEQWSGELVVFNAGSLAYPMRELLNAFVRHNPRVQPKQESSGSLEAARKLTELGKLPDLLAVADYDVIAKFLMPRYAAWYAGFASNAMVLAYSERSAAAQEISAANWWSVLLRPEIRWAHSNPALDPNGYRARMVFQLAESYYRKPGLAARLEAAMRPAYVRPSEAQLLGLVQAGELDYAWSYRSLAQTAGLRWITLPPEIDLSDAARAAEYATARVRLPGASLQGSDSVEFQGQPILYALTIPIEAPHPELAGAFVEFLFSNQGREILRRAGFTIPEHPVVVGRLPAIPALAR